MSLSELKIPQEWLDALRKVQDETGCEAFIAGGSLRDLAHGVVIKDVDIFVVPPACVLDPITGVVQDGRWFEAHAECLGFVHVCNLMYTEDENDIASVYELDIPATWYGGWEYQIISLRRSFNFRQVVERIDFGICQIGTNVDGDVYATDQFYVDSRLNRFTLTRPDDPRSKVRAKDRYQRLLVKYPGWAYDELA